MYQAARYRAFHTKSILKGARPPGSRRRAGGFWGPHKNREGDASSLRVDVAHSLLQEGKCPACGPGLAFIRVRKFGDLYQCGSGLCKCQVMHYRNKTTRICDCSVICNYGLLGEWTACGAAAAKGE